MEKLFEIYFGAVENGQIAKRTEDRRGVPLFLTPQSKRREGLMVSDAYTTIPLSESFNNNRSRRVHSDLFITDAEASNLPPLSMQVQIQNATILGHHLALSLYDSNCHLVQTFKS